jgi:hypothetical protein
MRTLLLLLLLAQGPAPRPVPPPLDPPEVITPPNAGPDERCRDDCHNKHCPCYRLCNEGPESDECKKQCDKEEKSCKEACSAT